MDSSNPAGRMKVDSFLNGRLTRHRLPCLQPPTGPEAPPLRRIMLSQGELAQIHDHAEGMRYMAILELLEGSARGNHFHMHKLEHFYLIQGQVELVARDGETGPKESVLIEPGDLVIVQPGVAHALRVLHAGWGIEFSPQQFDPKDSHRVQIVPPEKKS